MTNNTVPKIVFVGTFPPTEEGIATFNNDLMTSTQKILGDSAQCVVCAINLNDTSPYYFDNKVVWEIDQSSIKTYIQAAENINSDPSIECVIIQHEYGIYGGTWGEYFTKFLKIIAKPKITILHTVLDSHTHETQKFHEVTDDIFNYSNAIVVLSKKSKELLTKKYKQNASKIYFIPHGIHPVKFIQSKIVKKDLGIDNKTILTTFGLLSRDKGIEYVIKAIPKIIEKYPNILYQILGRTHPSIIKNEGEKYRFELIKLVKKLKLRKNILFVDKYLSLDEIIKYLQATDVYIATSINPDQAVSGTFSYALGAGRAVVSTEFIQSKEMITKNVGRLVPPKNPKAYEDAIIEILSLSNLNKLHRVAYKKTRSMLWTNIAKKFVEIIQSIHKNEKANFSLPPIELDYLKKMTKKYGILQFATYDIPDEGSGYTLDDNARALIVTLWLLKNDNIDKKILNDLYPKYFRLIKKSYQGNSKFINYFDKSFNITEQNFAENTEESISRAMWALSETMASYEIKNTLRSKAGNIYFDILKSDLKIDHPRTLAFLIKSFSVIFKNSKTKNGKLIKAKTINYADSLVSSYNDHSHNNWNWFGSHLTYNNGIIPESMFLSYKITKDKKYLDIAKKTINFLIKKTFMGDVYVPIGQQKWFKKHSKRSYFDQQPEDTSSIILALITAFEITNDKKYIRYAKKAFTWYQGNNLVGIPLYNYKTKGVYDGLNELGVNKNQGAESLVSYLLARTLIQKYF